jgi:hypothetical protein
MAFNLRNRSFLKVDFTPGELRYLLRLAGRSSWPSTPAPR